MSDFDELMSFLKKQYPDAKYYLEFTTPLELLVAAILSAQCRDETVNAVTKKLFAKYKKADDYANARLSAIASDIKSITFYENKAKNLKGVGEVLIRDYKGKVPDKMEELLKLPGVGRKTANVVLANAFHKIEGIPVDTHVIRVSYRLGIVSTKTPDKLEEELKQLLPKAEWEKFPHYMKSHGRAICTPVPHCRKCEINYLCKKRGVTKRKWD
jgi:endonuclease-3